MIMARYRIATIPGDGIGPEVMESAVSVLNALAEKRGDLSFEFTEIRAGDELKAETGMAMQPNTIDKVRESDATLFVAVGETAKEAQEISVAAGQQKGSIDTVSQSLDKISGIASDTSASGAQLVESTKTLLSNMQELAATSQTLAEMSGRFQQTVERFTIGEVVSAKPVLAVGAGKAKSTARRGAKTAEKE